MYRVCLACKDVQHGCEALIQGEDCLYVMFIFAQFLFPLMFDWCNAILTDNLTRTKEEGVTLQRRLDQTLSEIFNIWPSCTLPLSLSPSAPIVAGSLKWLLLLMLGFVLTYSVCPRNLRYQEETSSPRISQKALVSSGFCWHCTKCQTNLTVFFFCW